MTEILIPEELMPRRFGRDPDDGSQPVFPRDVPELQQSIEANVHKRDFGRRFAEKLKHNSQLTHLGWVAGYHTQFMFDCVSTIRSLEVLEIGLSRVADLSGITRLSNLNCLAMDTTGPATDLSPICQLKSLVSLSLGLSKRITTLDDSSTNSLSSLRALLLGSSSDAPVTLESLEPLGAIESLEYLVLVQVRSKDPSLAAIAKLPRLKAFQYDRNARFDLEDLDTMKARGVEVFEF